MEEKIQRLSEGMDFIEEAYGYSEPLQYTEVTESMISESKGSRPSNFKILGRCSGVFQPIGEYSRNKRIYSKDLWPRILEGEELKTRLAHRAVFGCLGHADKLVDDKDIQEGKVSHIVTVLEVRKDETNNPYLYGELEILDTPAGRILEAMYKGRADLYVSSRAAGRLTPIPNDPENRMLVSPSNYFFHCFDIVARPGFTKARPAFEAVSVEPVQHAVSESTSESAITTSNITTATPITSANEEVAELKGQVEKLAKILEKVVDDVYEEEATEKAVETKAETPKITSEALDNFTKLMINSNISEEAFAEVLEMLLKGNEDNVQ